MPTRWLAATALLGSLTASAALFAQTPARRPLTEPDLNTIAQLLMLEDTRTFDQDVIGAALKSPHPEVRRRAAIAIARIVKPEGRALLEAAGNDANVEVAAAVVFAMGQQKNPENVAWLGEKLNSPKSPPAVAREAATALGKVRPGEQRSPEARAALVKFLSTAPKTAANATIAGEAMLSLGRFPYGDDAEVMIRWADSPDVTVRWKAAWGLFRPRDPKAIPTLLKLADDPSPDVRMWAVRGLGAAPVQQQGREGAPPPPPVPVDPPGLDRAKLAAVLRAKVKDPDRRVRTEAFRTLASYLDDESFAIVLAGLESPDTWISVMAADSITTQASRYRPRSAEIVPKLAAAAAAGKPLALRISAVAALAAYAPEAAVEPAALLAQDTTSVDARNAGRGGLRGLGPAGQARLAELPAPAPAAPQPAAPPARTLADYRKIVDKYVLPDYKGAPKPRAIWTTPRGTIEIELYPGDAPIGTDYFVHLVESGDIVDTEVGRNAPGFVIQFAATRNTIRQRDEVNQRGLTRGNLAWASAGLDTGRPGYTLGNQAQPHNEGDFTSLGRVIRGMDVVDRLERTDRITAARMVK